MVRVRFAPSPTGELHIGGARTALYNYLFAKQNNGKFILRLEDTDRERYQEGSDQRLLEDLTWLGLNWDEGPEIGGKYGPYVQSQRLKHYQQYAQELLTKGSAYYCFCSTSRLTELRNKQDLAKLPTKYDRCCLKLDQAGINQKLAAGEPYVIRLKIPQGETNFTDTVHGQIKVDNTNIDDQVLIKSDGFPTYHLANVVDDHLMEITDVIRGEEWLPSTPKHVILYQAFGWNMPTWTHLPSVLNKNRAKLSKRKDGEGVWVSTYRREGYLPSAIINFLALLGWHPSNDKEIFTISELIKEFDFPRIQKTGGVFDTDKLKWFNAQYIKALPPQEFDKILVAYEPKVWKNQAIAKIRDMLQTRLITLSEATSVASYFLNDDINFNPIILIPKKGDKIKTKDCLEQGSNILASLKSEDWTIDSLKKNLEQLITEKKLTKMELLWPIRVALTGQEHSPDVFEVLVSLGQEKSIARIKSAVKLL